MFDYDTAQYVTGAYVYPSICIFGLLANIASFVVMQKGKLGDFKGTSAKYLRMIGK